MTVRSRYFLSASLAALIGLGNLSYAEEAAAAEASCASSQNVVQCLPVSLMLAEESAYRLAAVGGR